MRTERWRYIRYKDGSEELYYHAKDEYEHRNLASNPEFTKIKAELAQKLPKKNAPSKSKTVVTKPSKKKKKNGRQTGRDPKERPGKTH